MENESTQLERVDKARKWENLVARLPVNLQESAAVAEVLVWSGFFADAPSVSAALVKVMAGAEVGLSAVAAQSLIYIMDTKAGKKIAYAATLMAAKVAESGRWKCRIKTWTDQECVLLWWERDRDSGAWEPLGESSWSVKDANRAGTRNMDRYPKAMLWSRALTQGVRAYCPGVMMGAAAYAPEDFMDDVVPEGAQAAPAFIAPRRLSESVKVEEVQEAIPAPWEIEEPASHLEFIGEDGVQATLEVQEVQEAQVGQEAEKPARKPRAKAARAPESKPQEVQEVQAKQEAKASGKNCQKHGEFGGLFCPRCMNGE